MFWSKKQSFEVVFRSENVILSLFLVKTCHFRSFFILGLFLAIFTHFYTFPNTFVTFLQNHLVRLHSEANELRAQCTNLKVVLRIRPPKTLEHESPAFNIKQDQVDDDKENNSETSTNLKTEPETYDLVQLTSVTQQRGILSTRHNQQEKIVNYKFNKIYKSKTNQAELFQGICSPVIDDFFRGKNGFLMDYRLVLQKCHEKAENG